MDIHAECRACVEALRAAGRPAAARRIDAALAGSTSTEILVTLGAEITALLRGRPPLPPEFAARLRAVLREADRILGRSR